jgi:hypothetical protein
MAQMVFAAQSKCHLDKFTLIFRASTELSLELG